MNDLISLEKIAQWQKLKTLVLDSVSSPITKRVYNMALDEFMGWFQQAPRPGITRVKSAKTQGIRVGNWLSLRQAQALLSTPDITTIRGLRDRAILAVLLGC